MDWLETIFRNFLFKIIQLQIGGIQNLENVFFLKYLLSEYMEYPL